MTDSSAAAGIGAGIALALGLFGLSACTAGPAVPPDAGPPTRAVHVVSNNWHTGIVVPRAAILATGLMPEAGDFPDAAYLTFGWGDRDYYPAPEATVGMALGAALVPTPAVMHVEASPGPPAPVPGGREVLRVPLSDSGLDALVAAIAADFERPEGAPARLIAPGLGADSGFYPARGSFHLFNTCNTWTARMLRAGGVDIAPAGVVSASDLTARLQAALDAQPRAAPQTAAAATDAARRALRSAADSRPPA